MQISHMMTVQFCFWNFPLNTSKNLTANKPHPYSTRKDHQVTLLELPRSLLYDYCRNTQVDLPFVIVAEPHPPTLVCCL